MSATIATGGAKEGLHAVAERVDGLGEEQAVAERGVPMAKTAPPLRPRPKSTGRSERSRANGPTPREKRRRPPTRKPWRTSTPTPFDADRILIARHEAEGAPVMTFDKKLKDAMAGLSSSREGR